MKVKCIISHEQTLKNSGFRIYEAGRTYEVENPDPKYFEIEKETENRISQKDAEQASMTEKRKGGYNK